jgi:hypothetical protein
LKMPVTVGLAGRGGGMAGLEILRIVLWVFRWGLTGGLAGYGGMGISPVAFSTGQKHGQRRPLPPIFKGPIQINICFNGLGPCLGRIATTFIICHRYEGRRRMLRWLVVNVDDADAWPPLFSMPVAATSPEGLRLRSRCWSTRRRRTGDQSTTDDAGQRASPPRGVSAGLLQNFQLGEQASFRP